MRLERLLEGGPRVALVGAAGRGVEAGQFRRPALQHDPMHRAHQPDRDGVVGEGAVSQQSPARTLRLHVVGHMVEQPAVERRPEAPAPVGRSAEAVGQHGPPPLGSQRPVIQPLGGGAQARRHHRLERGPRSVGLRLGLELSGGVAGGVIAPAAEERRQRDGITQAESTDAADTSIGAEQLAHRQVSRTDVGRRRLELEAGDDHLHPVALGRLRLERDPGERGVEAPGGLHAGGLAQAEVLRDADVDLHQHVLARLLVPLGLQAREADEAGVVQQPARHLHRARRRHGLEHRPRPEVGRVLTQLAPRVGERVRAVLEADGHRAEETGLRSGDQLGHQPVEAGFERRGGGGLELARVVDEDVAVVPEQVPIAVRVHRLQQRRVGGARCDRVDLVRGRQELDHRGPHSGLRGQLVQRGLVHQLEMRAVRPLEGAQGGGDALALLGDELDRRVGGGDENPRAFGRDVVELGEPLVARLRTPPVDAAGTGDPAAADDGHGNAAPAERPRACISAVGAFQEDGANRRHYERTCMLYGLFSLKG